MTIGGYLYSKLTGSTTITSYTTRVSPDKGDYATIPCIVYSVISENANQLIMKRPIVTIKYFNTTQDSCYGLGEAIYNLFDSSTKRVYELSGDMKVESVAIVNHVSAQWDSINRVWFGATDLRVNYIK